MYRNYRNGWQSEARRAAYVSKAVSKFDAPVYSIGTFLAAVAEVIRTKGFMKELCASDAFQLVVANKDGDHEFAVEDWVTAAEAVAWISEKAVRPGFEADLQAAVSCPEIPQSKMKLVTYAIKMYVEAKAVSESAAESTSEYVGTLGGKVALSLKVVSSDYSSSEWGVSYYTVATDASGNVVVWYAKEQLEAGDSVNITGKVKKQYEGKYGKTTVLNYVKVV